MTASLEPTAAGALGVPAASPAPSALGARPASRAPSAFDAAWRAERERTQQHALPGGRVLVTCSAPLGTGGLGRHLLEIVRALERRGAAATCFCASSPPPLPASLASALRSTRSALGAATRFSPAWQTWVANAGFDAEAARSPAVAEHLIAFNGQALTQFRARAGAGVTALSLMSANSHMRRVLRMHERAHRQYPIERSWAGRLLARNLAEYELAERIYVASQHAYESFLEAGVAERRLSLFPLTPDPRFAPAEPGERASDCFEVVYVGSLSVVKGVPLLIEAIGRLSHRDLRLVLVGGWTTRSMRRFVERARARDARIRIEVGDPLPHLRRAAVCVHPSYEDGFGYAPVEALACGVPAIVSENTGAKELIAPSRNGLVVATGDADALAQAIDGVYRGELPRG